MSAPPSRSPAPSDKDERPLSEIVSPASHFSLFEIPAAPYVRTDWTARRSPGVTRRAEQRPSQNPTEPSLLKFRNFRTVKPSLSSPPGQPSTRLENPGD